LDHIPGRRLWKKPLLPLTLDLLNPGSSPILLEKNQNFSALQGDWTQSQRNYGIILRLSIEIGKYFLFYRKYHLNTTTLTIYIELYKLVMIYSLLWHKICLSGL